MTQSQIVQCPTMKNQAAANESQAAPDTKEDRMLSALMTAPCKIEGLYKPTEMTIRSAPLPTNIRRFLDVKTNVAVMFTSPYKREGAPKVAFETARSAALQTTGKVLYFHISSRPEKFFRNIEDKIPAAMDDFINIGNGSTVPFIVLEDSGLVCTYIRGSAEGMGQENLRTLISSLRKYFELIVLGGDGVLTGGASSAFSDLVDGIILVAEAERTRVPVARKTKRTIEENGGKVVGAILNRRKLHIPDWIYRLLYGRNDEFGYCP